MSSCHWLILAAGTVLVGLIRQVFRYRDIRSERDLVASYLLKFDKWCIGKARNHLLYDEMMMESDIVQKIVGHFGIVSYADPTYSSHNHAVILNEIPQIRHGFFDDLIDHSKLARQQLQTRIDTVGACLRRYLGSTKERMAKEWKRFFNPLVLFGSGIAWVLEIPLTLIYEIGIISKERQAKLVQGRLIRVLKIFVLLATFLATVITIVVGWEEFNGWIRSVVSAE